RTGRRLGARAARVARAGGGAVVVRRARLEARAGARATIRGAVLPRAVVEDERVVVIAVHLRRRDGRPEAVARAAGGGGLRAVGAGRAFHVEPARPRSAAEAVVPARASAVVGAVVVGVLSVRHGAAHAIRLRVLQIGAAGVARVGARCRAAHAVDAEAGDA